MMRFRLADPFVFSACLTMACTVLSGCGSAENASRTTAQPSAGTELSAPPALLPAPVSVAASPAVQSDQTLDTTVAQQLFETLLKPGVSTEEWEETHAQLLQEGPPAVRLLAGKLITGIDAERELAATTLALLGPDASAAQRELETALQDRSPFVQANAAATLVQIPECASAAIPTLARLLLADDPQLRQMAAVNLNAAGVAPTDQIETLKQALTQQNSEEVLTPVVELLGRIGPAAVSVLPELQKISVEQSGDLQAAASSAIQLIKGEAVAP